MQAFNRDGDTKTLLARVNMAIHNFSWIRSIQEGSLAPRHRGRGSSSGYDGGNRTPLEGDSDAILASFKQNFIKKGFGPLIPMPENERRTILAQVENAGGDPVGRFLVHASSMRQLTCLINISSPEFSGSPANDTLDHVRSTIYETMQAFNRDGDTETLLARMNEAIHNFSWIRSIQEGSLAPRHRGRSSSSGYGGGDPTEDRDRRTYPEGRYGPPPAERAAAVPTENIPTHVPELLPDERATTAQIGDGGNRTYPEGGNEDQQMVYRRRFINEGFEPLIPTKRDYQDKILNRIQTENIKLKQKFLIYAYQICIYAKKLMNGYSDSQVHATTLDKAKNTIIMAMQTYEQDGQIGSLLRHMESVRENLTYQLRLSLVNRTKEREESSRKFAKELAAFDEKEKKVAKEGEEKEIAEGKKEVNEFLAATNRIIEELESKGRAKEIAKIKLMHDNIILFIKSPENMAFLNKKLDSSDQSYIKASRDLRKEAGKVKFTIEGFGSHIQLSEPTRENIVNELDKDLKEKEFVSFLISSSQIAEYTDSLSELGSPVPQIRVDNINETIKDYLEGTISAEDFCNKIREKEEEFVKEIEEKEIAEEKKEVNKFLAATNRIIEDLESKGRTKEIAKIKLMHDNIILSMENPENMAFLKKKLDSSDQSYIKASRDLRKEAGKVKFTIEGFGSHIQLSEQTRENIVNKLDEALEGKELVSFFISSIEIAEYTDSLSKLGSPVPQTRVNIINETIEDYLEGKISAEDFCRKMRRSRDWMQKHKAKLPKERDL
jgi:hypothetical protein